MGVTSVQPALEGTVVDTVKGKLLNCLLGIIIFGSFIAHIALYNVSMRFQRALEIITLDLAPAAVISARCISRNNPTRYPFTSPGSSVDHDTSTIIPDQCYKMELIHIYVN